MTSPLKTETRHHPLGKTCHHFTYHGLTCDQYDDLRARSGGHCEICGVDEKDTPRGALVVDHFRGKTTRVTRGMICDKCNCGVMQCIDGNKVWGANRALEGRAREYERNSWETPSPRARQEMDARTEMLSKFHPDYEHPARHAYVPMETGRPTPRPISLDGGPAAIARRLKKYLTAQQIERLVVALTDTA